MQKLVVPLIIGLVIGSLVTWLLPANDSAALTASRTAATTEQIATESRSEPATKGTSTQLLAWRQAQLPATADGIESRLAELFALPFSVARDAEVAALFQRLAEFDLRRAIRVAQTPGFDRSLITGVFHNLAASDPELALQALAAVSNPGLQIDIAVAVLAALGNDPNSLEEIAQALPEHQRRRLRVEALGELARKDPQGALRAALGFADAGTRHAAAQRVGVEWARQDPLAAFEQRASLPTEIRDAYRDSVVQEWARFNASSFLDYADTLATLDELTMGLLHTIAVDPERTFEVASTRPAIIMPDNIGAAFTIERFAFMNAAWLDPDHYRAMVEAMPEGPRKQILAPAFIEMYARTDPEAALAWARNQSDSTYPGRVIRNTALVDPALSYKWMNEQVEERGNTSGTGPIVQFIGVFGVAGPWREDFATEVLHSDAPMSTTVLAQMLGNWVQSEPVSALDWMLANGAEVDASLAASIAGSLAQRDAKLAADYLDLVPAEHRRSWLEQVAPQYARQDPDHAAVWLSQFQGEPGFSDIYGRAVQLMASSDPRTAADMLSSAPVEIQRNLAPNLVNQIAQQDLAGAARWAASIPDADARGRAVGQAAFSWTSRDPRAAQRWVSSLAPGEARDQALSATLSGLTRDGFYTELDPDIIEDFQSDDMREQSVSNLVRSMALQDPDGAQDLLDEWVSDPLLRQQTESAIANARELRGR